jgi:hypothetical protein
MLIDIFKLSLSKVKIKNWDYKKSLISENKFLYTQEQKTEQIDSFLKIFKEDIDSSLNEFEINEYKIIDVWSLYYEKNKFHQIHNHRSLGFTGIIYFDYDNSEHNSTNFIIPWNDPIKDTIKTFNLDDVNEGYLIIFPSLLIHFTDPNLSDKKRRIIAFDLISRNNASYSFY